MATFGASVLRASTVALILSVSASSAAHLDMELPVPRLRGQANDPELKQGPCGQSTNQRSANVTEFAPGETITVRWNEYIDHPSYYRIAFDDDGDDGFEMRSDGQTNAAQDNPEMMEEALGMDAEILAIVREENDQTPGAGTDIREARVTLPNIECENCTLQIIQYMYNNPNQGYYQCADLVLSGESVNGDGGVAGNTGLEGSGGSGGSGSGNATGQGGASSSVPPAGGRGGTSSSGDSSSTGAAPSGTGGSAPPFQYPEATGDDEADDGGCAIRAPGTASAANGFEWLAFGLGALLASRRSGARARR